MATPCRSMWLLKLHLVQSSQRKWVIWVWAVKDMAGGQLKLHLKRSISRHQTDLTPLKPTKTNGWNLKMMISKFGSSPISRSPFSGSSAVSFRGFDFIRTRTMISSSVHLGFFCISIYTPFDQYTLFCHIGVTHSNMFFNHIIRSQPWNDRIIEYQYHTSSLAIYYGD